MRGRQSARVDRGAQLLPARGDTTEPHGTPTIVGVGRDDALHPRQESNSDISAPMPVSMSGLQRGSEGVGKISSLVGPPMQPYSVGPAR